MATSKNKYILQAETKGFNKAQQKTKKLGGGMKSLALRVGAVAGAYFGAQGLIRGLKAVISLTGEQELAEKKLDTAFRGNTEGLKRYARELQQVTRFGDEAVMGVMTIISAFNKDEEAIRQLTKATLDLAEGTGMDLKSAGDLVSKSIGSSTNALSRYGIEVVGAVGSTERLDSMLGNISDKFEGQATASAQTMTGSLAQMHNALGDLGETIGTHIAPAVTGMARWFKDVAESVGEFFTRASETSLETSIRQLKEMGVATLDLEKALSKKEVFEGTKSLRGLESEVQLRVKSRGHVKQITDLTSELAKKQAELYAKGTSEEELQAIRLNGRSVRIKDNGLEIARQVRLAGEQADEELKVLELLKKQIAEHVAGNEEAIEGIALWTELNLSKEHLLAIEKAIAEEQEKQKETVEETIKGVETVVELTKEELLALEKAQSQAKQLAQWSASTSASLLTSAIMGDNVAEGLKRAVIQLLIMVAQAKIYKAIMDSAGSGGGGIFQTVAKFFFGHSGGMVTPHGIKNFHTGGQAGADVPAVLQQGEFVMQRSAVESIGVNNLQDMNRGGGGGGITLNISAPLVDDTIVDVIVPAIERAKREGLA